METITPDITYFVCNEDNMRLCYPVPMHIEVKGRAQPTIYCEVIRLTLLPKVDITFLSNVH